jgi:exonuclease VII large subunit
MDWTKQTEELFKTWTAAQQRMMESWLHAVQAYVPNQASDAWQQSLDAWRNEVQRALDAQLALSKNWSERMNTLSSSGSMGEMSKQFPEMMRSWTEAQSQLWQRWFDAAKQSAPASMASLFSGDEAKQVMALWQEASQKAVEAQMEWMRMMTGALKKD